MVRSRKRGARWPTLNSIAILLALAGGGCGEDGETLLSCQEGDSAFTLALQDDQTLKHLATCSLDADCELWDPTAVCASGLKLPNCSKAIGTDKSAAASARRDLLAAELCPQIATPCGIGITCAPNPVARCVQGSCRASFGL